LALSCHWEGDYFACSAAAAALFTFLGLSAATARANVISGQFGNNENFQVTILLQHSVEPDAAAVDPAFQDSNWNALLVPRRVGKFGNQNLFL
jgi:hypothetical protein